MRLLGEKNRERRLAFGKDQLEVKFGRMIRAELQLNLVDPRARFFARGDSRGADVPRRGRKRADDVPLEQSQQLLPALWPVFLSDLGAVGATERIGQERNAGHRVEVGRQ